MPVLFFRQQSASRGPQPMGFCFFFLPPRCLHDCWVHLKGEKVFFPFRQGGLYSAPSVSWSNLPTAAFPVHRHLAPASEVSLLPAAPTTEALAGRGQLLEVTPGAGGSGPTPTHGVGDLASRVVVERWEAECDERAVFIRVIAGVWGARPGQT